MSRDEIEQAVEQEVLSYGFKEDFKAYLAEERLLEPAKQEEFETFLLKEGEI